MLCCESALAFGGRIVLGRENGAWHAQARHEKLRIEALLWARLEGGAGGGNGGGDGAERDIAPSQAQFALVPAEAAVQGRRIAVQLQDQEILVSW